MRRDYGPARRPERTDTPAPVRGLNRRTDEGGGSGRSGAVPRSIAALGCP